MFKDTNKYTCDFIYFSFRLQNFYVKELIGLQIYLVDKIDLTDRSSLFLTYLIELNVEIYKSPYNGLAVCRNELLKIEKTDDNEMSSVYISRGCEISNNTLRVINFNFPLLLYFIKYNFNKNKYKLNYTYFSMTE